MPEIAYNPTIYNAFKSLEATQIISYPYLTSLLNLRIITIAKSNYSN